VSSVDPSMYFARSAAKNAFDTFSSQPQSLMFSQIGLLIWFIGGLFKSPELYFAGLAVSSIAAIFLIGEAIVDKKNKVDYIKKLGLNNLIIGYLSFWLYRWIRPGPDEMTFFTIEIAIYNISNSIIAFYALLWLSTRYLSPGKWATELTWYKSILLMVQGLAKSIILIALIIAMFSTNTLLLEFVVLLIVAYLIEPVSSYFFAKTDKIYSSSAMMMTDSKLPSSAFRGAMLNNMMILLLTGLFDSALGGQLGELRLIYIILLIYAFFYARNDAKGFRMNPFRGSSLDDFLNSTANSMKSVNENIASNVVNTDLTLNLSDTGQIKLNKGTAIIPLKETSKGISAVIVGPGESIIKHMQNQTSSSDFEGVTSTFIPKKEFNRIKNELSITPLKNLNLQNFGIESYEDLSIKINQLAVNMDNWINAAKSELLKFDLSNYSITETKEMTKVNLPGITVVDARSPKKFTRVKLPGISVLDQGKDGTVVRVLPLTVIDSKQFTFVNMPGLTVFDTKKHGTMVSIFGLKIGDHADASKLEEIKRQMLGAVDQYEFMFDSALEGVLGSKDSIAMFNLDSGNNFQPLLSSVKSTVTTNPALPMASAKFALNVGSTAEKTLPVSSQKTNDKPDTKLNKDKSQDKVKDKIIDTEYEIIDE
jgi:hypothetical protein